MRKYTKLEINDFIKNYIDNNKVLKNEVVSIYAMGSFSKYDNFNDIDLNFFCYNNNSDLINKISEMIAYFSEKYNIIIDPNIIDEDMFSEDAMNTKYFVHKFRASLLLFELKTLDNILYGERILDKVKIDRDELTKESKKLLLILRHRVSKDYLTKKGVVTSTYLRKNVKYAIEFFLANQGWENPYFVSSSELLLNYPCLKKYEDIIEIALAKVTDKTLNFEESYNFIIFLSRIVLKDKV
ncbi:hypothetical protein, partial [Helcococcus ovis]|uniref:hypothetical protein n=1 Tax=Helcococcus ovis TaxID=72026 RepID=UPI0038B92320